MRLRVAILGLCVLGVALTVAVIRNRSSSAYTQYVSPALAGGKTRFRVQAPADWVWKGNTAWSVTPGGMAVLALRPPDPQKRWSGWLARLFGVKREPAALSVVIGPFHPAKPPDGQTHVGVDKAGGGQVRYLAWRDVVSHDRRYQAKVVYSRADRKELDATYRVICQSLVEE